MQNYELSLAGKSILVTGVSRSMGIGAGIASRLAKAGAHVMVHGFAPYDATLQYPDADTQFVSDFVRELNEQGYKITTLPPSDLMTSGSAEKVVGDAVQCAGVLDGMVLNHAYSTWSPLGDWTEEHIDSHLIVNVRATMLMIQEFAKQLPSGKEGSITLFTSGQYLGPMIKEIAYAVSKDAVIGLCRQAAVALAFQRIRVNCINPGATDTGYIHPDTDLYKEIAAMFPAGRWGLPEDAARLVHFLQSDFSGWITGEVISSEGGFQRNQNV